MNLPAKPGLLRALGRTEAIALVLGSVIGSGIFFKPQRIADELGNFWWIIAVWVVAGVLCLMGALSLSELAAMLPRAGGLYVYLREAYGKLVAFLYGWSLLLVVRPAATGGLAAAFPESLPVSDAAKFAISILVILVIAWINIMGVLWGGKTQSLTTVVKAGFLLGIALLPWLLGQIEPANFASALSGDAVPVSYTKFMVALLAVMFAYNSWHEVTPLAEEIKEPERNLPFSLSAGVLLIVLLYVGANIAYHGVLPMAEVAAEKNAAKALMEGMIGPVGGTVMTILVMCSVFGTINANLMHAPRVYYAMGRDGVFFASLGWLHPTRRTPIIAILSQTVLSIVLIVIATYIASRGVFDFLTNVVVFGASVFYVLGVLAVIVLRFRQPDRPRPYRTLGYPYSPLLFIGIYALFLPTIYIERREESWIGLGVMALGIPVYMIWNRSRRGEHQAST